VGAVILLALAALGGLRELLGTGLTLAVLAPGAFICIGLLVALENVSVRMLGSGTVTPSGASREH
jgi:Na+-translocating ferredoxin:NAD+ oxidoreductase RnfE subunit